MMMAVKSLRPALIFTLLLGLLVVTQGRAEAAIDCFSCHDRDAFQKRVNHEPAAAGDCLACHNPHVARFEALLQDQVKDLCYSCHTEAAEKQSRGLVHKPVRTGECLGCHNPHASDQAGMLNDQLATTCFSCHQELPRQYKNTHTPYADGDCDSCHLPHQSEYPYLLAATQDQLCLECHSRPTLNKKHRNFPAELKNCGSCHHPHGSDRPALIRNSLHEPYAEGCSSCHEGKNVPVTMDTCLMCHPEVSEQMASSHSHLVRYQENGCMACHSPHAGDDKRLLKGKERHVCRSCHEATFARYQENEYKHQMTDACNNCHAPHGSNHPAMFKGPINDVCSECHDRHGVFTHPIGENILDPRTGQMMTCGSCHASKGTDHDYHTRFERKKALCVQCHAEY
jgi:predicted CXXCH cytochrome family protein